MLLLLALPTAIAGTHTLEEGVVVVHPRSPQLFTVRNGQKVQDPVESVDLELQSYELPTVQTAAVDPVICAARFSWTDSESPWVTASSCPWAHQQATQNALARWDWDLQNGAMGHSYTLDVVVGWSPGQTEGFVSFEPGSADEVEWGEQTPGLDGGDRAKRAKRSGSQTASLGALDSSRTDQLRRQHLRRESASEPSSEAVERARRGAND